jgi:hypothetical protein
MSQEEMIHKIVDEISFGLISPKDLRKQSKTKMQNLWQHRHPLPRTLRPHRTCRTNRTH